MSLPCHEDLEFPLHVEMDKGAQTTRILVKAKLPPSFMKPGFPFSETRRPDGSVISLGDGKDYRTSLGFSEVYQRFVALKFYAVAESPSGMESRMAERLMNLNDGSGKLPLLPLECGRHEDELFQVRLLSTGPTFQQLIARERPVESSTSLLLVQQLLDLLPTILNEHRVWPSLDPRQLVVDVQRTGGLRAAFGDLDLRGREEDQPHEEELVQGLSLLLYQLGNGDEEASFSSLVGKAFSREEFPGVSAAMVGLFQQLFHEQVAERPRDLGELRDLLADALLWLGEGMALPADLKGEDSLLPNWNPHILGEVGPHVQLHVLPSDSMTRSVWLDAYQQSAQLAEGTSTEVCTTVTEVICRPEYRAFVEVRTTGLALEDLLTTDSGLSQDGGLRLLHDVHEALLQAEKEGFSIPSLDPRDVILETEEDLPGDPLWKDVKDRYRVRLRVFPTHPMGCLMPDSVPFPSPISARERHQLLTRAILPGHAFSCLTFRMLEMLEKGLSGAQVELLRQQWSQRKPETAIHRARLLNGLRRIWPEERSGSVTTDTAPVPILPTATQTRVTRPAFNAVPKEEPSKSLPWPFLGAAAIVTLALVVFFHTPSTQTMVASDNPEEKEPLQMVVGLTESEVKVIDMDVVPEVDAPLILTEEPRAERGDLVLFNLGQAESQLQPQRTEEALPAATAGAFGPVDLEIALPVPFRSVGRVRSPLPASSILHKAALSAPEVESPPILLAQATGIRDLADEGLEDNASPFGESLPGDQLDQISEARNAMVRLERARELRSEGDLSQASRELSPLMAMDTLPKEVQEELDQLVRTVQEHFPEMTEGEQRMVRSLIRDAAEGPGHPGAAGLLAAWMADSESSEEALSWTRKAAHLGDVDSMARLGLYHATGDQLPLDLSRALDWFRKAADAGHPEGLYYLGECYLFGKGTTPEPERAVELLEKAHRLGEARATDMLATCYSKGLGVDQNLERAYALFEEAIDRGNLNACGNLGVLYMQGQGAPADPRRAAQLFLQGAEGGIPDSMAFLALCLENGLGVEGDQEAARDWYVKAASQGQPKALRWVEAQGIEL